MNGPDKTKEELTQALQYLQQKYDALKTACETDSAENKQVARALKESKNRLRDITFSMADWVWEVDEHGVYTYTSQKSFDFIGQTHEYAIGKKPFDFMPPDEAKRVAAIFSELFAKKAPIKDLENNIIGKNGEKICLLTNGVPILDENGNLKGYRGVDKDITERKQAENLLAQTRTNYETFFNTIDDFLFILDVEGNIIHTNTTVIGRLGYTPEELFGKSVLMVHPPDCRDEAGRIVGEMLNGKATFCPVPIITKSGVQIPVETRVSHGFWDGKPAIFGVTKDISQIKFSEEKFSKLFHINPSACGLTDLENHKYIEVNEAFYNLFGFDKNEVIGKTAAGLGLLTTESINAITGKLDSNGKADNIEAELTAKNGAIKYVLLSAENIYVQDKKYRYTIVHDITERKLAEEKLQESEEKHRLLIENSHDIIYTLNPEGVFVFVSSAWTAFLGHPVEQVAGQPFQLFVHPDDVPACFEFLHRVIETGQRQEGVEYRVQHIDGTWYWHTSSAVPMKDETGMVIGFEGVARDITERKKAEQEIFLKNKELLELNAEKDKFFSIIAHDLRSPFNVFLGLTRMMVENLSTLTLDEIQKFAEKMRNSANKLFNLLENLLEWSQIQRGLLSYKPESILFLNVIIVIIELARGEADKKLIRISYDVPEDLRIIADVKMFESLMRNFVFNAIKFTPKCGKITIAAKPIPGNSVEVSIMDTGIGMNKMMIDNLFRHETQIIRQGTEGEPSTGLGLIICKEFIEKHGGKIWVESEEEKGSTFYFTIPCAKA